MRAVIPILVLILIAGALGCDSGNRTACLDPPAPVVAETDGIEVRVQVTDGFGTPCRVFTAADDLHFEYTVMNRTGNDLPWSAPHSGPLARAWINAGNLAVGSSADGLYAPGSQSGVLAAGETRTFRARWLDSPFVIPLPPGRYQAGVGPGFSFSGDRRPPSVRFDFVMDPLPGTELVAAFYPRPAFGFCPRLDAVYYALVLRRRDGVLLLQGSFARTRPVADDCVPTVFGECLVLESIPLRELTPAQGQEITRLVAAHPRATPTINGACDPCRITQYHLPDGVYEATPCATGPPEVVEHQYDLEEYIRSLVETGG